MIGKGVSGGDGIMQPGLLHNGAPQDENVCSGGVAEDFLNGEKSADTSF